MSRTASVRPAFGRRTEPHRLIIARGDRVNQVILPPWGLGALAVAFVAVFLWAAGATGFVIFRDDFVASMLNRQAAEQYVYENRIKVLRTQLEKSKSIHLVEQATLADKVESLLRRQASLEARQSVIQTLEDVAEDAGIAVDRPRPLDDASASAGPAPESEPIEVRPAIHPGAADARLSFLAPDGTEETVDRALDDVSRSLAAIEGRQFATLGALQRATTRRKETIRDVVASIGLDVDRLVEKSPSSAVGGPFVPLEPGTDPSEFETAALRLHDILTEAERLDHVARALPLRRPMAKAEITSGFGPRRDPFLGTSAMHSGIDFRERVGAPVRVPAAGRVIHAGWSGGYGNMVEVDHGNGITTRYGHLSEILVSDGDRVNANALLGRVGSTGRSTGPHLHYETRVRGDAIDPMRFLRAGRALGS